MSTQVVIRGSLGNAPDFKSVVVKSGRNAGETRTAIEFSVRSEINQKQQDGSYKLLSGDWKNCVYWTPNAEHLAKILQKGSPVIIIGSERVTPYEKDGQTKLSRRIIVDQLALNLNARVTNYDLLPAKSSEESGLTFENPPSGDSEVFDDDIPF